VGIRVRQTFPKQESGMASENSLMFPSAYAADRGAPGKFFSYMLTF
jgi:hypothetical protein